MRQPERDFWRNRLGLPAAVKQPLVRVWNAAHRFGWAVCDHGCALFRGVRRCEVCGKLRPMLYRRRVIPKTLEQRWGLTPELAEALARRESMNCVSCGAKLRARRLARVILECYPVGDPPAPARSLLDWVVDPQIRRLRIAEINRIDGVHEVLSRLPGLMFSDYAEFASESNDNAPRSEDLTRLTYSDRSFDLVLTSETLEHVPDLGRALAEIHRVLVPGGLHIFTVPVLPGITRTYARARLRPDGTMEPVAPMIFHPGGDVGYLVFTEIGSDFPDRLRESGFEVEIRFGPTRAQDLAQVYVCRKPA